MKHDPMAGSAGRFRSVMIVDDHPLYGDALGAALRLHFPNCAVLSAGTLHAALSLMEDRGAPDLVLFDLKLPDVDGIGGFRTIRDAAPGTPILVISSLASIPVVRALLDEGAAGFLPKEASCTVLRRALDEIAAGRRFVPDDYAAAPEAHGPAEAGGADRAVQARLAELTPQQTRIMRMICAGKPNKQIAYEMSLAEATVKAHITALLRRLGVQNRTQAAVMAEAALGPAGRRPGPETEARAFLGR